ncbi:MAG: type II toxin-antitoxin system RelE family toxin [Gammaproteobacteria bacterium]
MSRHTVSLSKNAVKFLKKLPEKQEKQIKKQILLLAEEPYRHDSKQLKGTKEILFRSDVGEYRIIYLIQEHCLIIRTIGKRIGKRNDGEVYRNLL